MSTWAVLWIFLGVIFLGTILVLEAQMIVVVNDTLIARATSNLDYAYSFKWLIGVSVGVSGVITLFISIFTVYLCRVSIDCQLADLGPFQRAKFIGLLQQQDFDEGKIKPIIDGENVEKFGRK